MAKGKTSRILVWGLLGLLIVGLAGFGATNFGGAIRSVGTVGNTEIDLNRYARALQQEIRAITAETGRTVTLSEAQAVGIPQAVLSRTVAAAALEDEAAELGLSIGDESVREQIFTIPAFQGIDGSFDRQAYTFALDQSGLSVAEFEAAIRHETAANLVQNAVTAGVSAPSAFADTIYAYAREERDVTWARLGPENLEGEAPVPAEADLQAYHDGNPERFTVPETRVITYAWLTPDMIVDSVEPDEDALRALYEQRIDEFVQPERRLVERLVFATEDAATEAKARLDAGETTYDDLVAERGLSLDDVDMGDVSETDLGAAGAAVFGLDGPGVVGPESTSLGPALFRMNAILAAQDVPFEEARDELVAEAAMDRARRIIQDQIDDLDDRLAGGATLEELADETEMELGQIDWRDDVSDGIAAYDGFREAAAAATVGDFPEIVQLDEGGLFALRLDEIRPPELRPLDAVRDQVTELWTAEETGRRLAAQAETVAEQIRGGREMAALRLALGTDRNLTRDSFVEGTPGDFVTEVFAMESGEVRVIPGERAAYIVRLDAVRPADQDTPEARALKLIFSQQASQGMASDILSAFTQGLIVSKGVRIDQSAVNAVHAQFP